MKVHNPPAVHTAPTYSHGIEVPPNARSLYISGQVGAGRDGKPLDGIEAQTKQAFEDLIDGFRKVRAEQMGDHRPASTLVIARRLAQPGWLIEIEAIAAKA